MDMRRSTAIVLAVVLTSAVVVPEARAGKAGEVRTTAFTLLNQGVAAYNRGEYKLAVERLEASASMALNSFRAYFYLGLALIGDRRYSDAVSALEVALDLDPTHLQSLIATGDAHLKLGDLEEARATYFRALKLRPEYAPALDGLARIFEARNEDDEAVAHFRRAIDSDPGYAPAFTHLGDYYLRQNLFEEAVRLLEEAVSVRPDFAPGLNRLAIAYGRLGLDNEAVATVRRAMEIQPSDASHPATLGWLQLRQGFPETAAEWFGRSLELDAANPEARHGLAEVARRAGDYDEALDQLDIALDDPRIAAAAALRLAEVKASIEQERERLAALEQRAGESDAAADDLAELAGIYAARGLWNEAIERQRLAGETPEQRERLAYMLFRAERYEEAHAIYRDLAAVAPRAELEVNAGVSVALLGDDRGAVAAFRRALELDPDLEQARLYLGSALLRLGLRDEAVVAYRRFLDLGTRGEAAERVRRILAQIAPETRSDPAPSGDGGSSS